MDKTPDILEEAFPDAHCELGHKNTLELLIAIVLSTQTTGATINKVTPTLLEAFKTPQAVAETDIRSIKDKIRRIGLHRSEARSIQNLSRSLLESFNGVVPESMKELTSLAGVGRRTANVVCSVCFDIPSIAVDIHMERTSKRLGLAKVQNDVEVVEQKPKRGRWDQVYHLFIFFGRYFCMARNPKYEGCPSKEFYKKDKLEAYRNSKKS